jgi:GNAT superfamily N-acetyltransferase
MNNERQLIRLYQSKDELAVVEVWHRAGRTAFPTWQTFTLEQARAVFHKVILAHCDIWVGTRDERIVAYLAMKGSYLDRLFVDPSEQRQGWGTRFINFAKQRSPNGLELHTHQENQAARALYEKHGFVAVKFGVSPPPESALDVEYHWRP